MLRLPGPSEVSSPKAVMQLPLRGPSQQKAKSSFGTQFSGIDFRTAAVEVTAGVLFSAAGEVVLGALFSALPL